MWIRSAGSHLRLQRKTYRKHSPYLLFIRRDRPLLLAQQLLPIFHTEEEVVRSTLSENNLPAMQTLDLGFLGFALATAMVNLVPGIGRRNRRRCSRRCCSWRCCSRRCCLRLDIAWRTFTTKLQPLCTALPKLRLSHALNFLAITRAHSLF